jgi:WhiB family transcriptional regulator, redox-sensing transcriptional regulator
VQLLSVDDLERAACASMDTATFFPRRGDRAAVRRAKAVCRACPVQQECLAAALRIRSGYDRDGIFGGTSPKQRRAMRAKMTGRASVRPPEPERDRDELRDIKVERERALYARARERALERARRRDAGAAG